MGLANGKLMVFSKEVQGDGLAPLCLLREVSAGTNLGVIPSSLPNPRALLASKSMAPKHGAGPELRT